MTLQAMAVLDSRRFVITPRNGRFIHRGGVFLVLYGLREIDFTLISHGRKKKCMSNSNENGITLAKNLKHLSRTTSVRRLASAAKVPVSSLNSWCHGQMPSGEKGHKNLRRLSRYLGVTIEQLMYGDISKEPPKEMLITDLLGGDKVFSGRFMVDLKVRRLPDND